MILRWVATGARNRGGPLSAALFAAVAVVLVYNALSLHGDAVSMMGDAALQTAAGATVICCGLLFAFRETGAARMWRLLIVAAMTCWLGAQFASWGGAQAAPGGPTRWIDIGHLAFYLLASAALLVLAWSGRPRSPTPRDDREMRPSIAVLVLDGLVAAASFAVLVWSARIGNGSPAPSAADQRAEAVIHPLAVLIVVVLAVMLSVAYGTVRRFRVNFQLLAAGVLTVVASDRLAAYLTGIGMESETVWVDVGLVLGPMMIAYSTAGLRNVAASRGGRRLMVWSQLLMPYIAASGMTVLMGFHILTGRPTGVVQVGMSVTVVFLLMAQQIVSIRENRQLMSRVMAGQDRLVHQVHHDSLTGLPNRLHFADRLNGVLPGGGPFVLIYLDLDDFKDVNDRYGHASGDRLLQAVGRRLSGCARDVDTVARIGGDEFGILVPGEVGSPDVIADRFRAALRPPFALHGHSVRVRASMGVVTPDPNASPLSPDELLRRADSSMYEGKRQGKNSVVLYGQSFTAATDFATALRQADGATPPDFRIVYQPIVGLPDGAPVALEALSRWTAPNGTHIAPETFVAAAEAAGMGAEFDLLVLHTVCAEIAAAGIDLAIHVNIGAARLGDSWFERAVVETLRSHGVAPQQVILEITESVPIVDLADGAAAVKRLQATGIRVALDDFGAGYNTLTYLHALPVDLVKLDRALTIGIDPGHDAVLYRSVLGICEQLGIGVIAEGVETQAQADTILAAGCTVAQGYRFGRPAPIAEVGWRRDQRITSGNAAR